jgi:hypothetical protein
MLRRLYRWAALAMLSTGVVAVSAVAQEQGRATPVVVELFTSQGCSSCPPADALLGELSKRPNIVALAFHVDYWDYIGWKDPFASPQFTQRQHDYGRTLGLHMVYTPQMVIDGRIDAVGSHRTAVEQAIAASSKQPKLAVTVRGDRASGYRVSVAQAEAGLVGPAVVWLVLFDREHMTPVKRGENAGATLKDYNVVRAWRRLGEWTGEAVELPIDIDSAAITTGGYAVILQADPVGPVLGAAVLTTDNGS